MKRFIAGAERGQSTLLPECLDEWVDEDKPARAIDAFVDALGLSELGFMGVKPAATGRPGYHPAPLPKLYIYGYVNRVQSSRRLEREAGRRCLAAIGRSGRKRVTWLRQSAHNRGAEKRVNPRNPLA
jgi:transposase